MIKKNYVGRTQPVERIYNSLKNYVGENKVFLPGDILCVSQRNNDDYDLFLVADGVSDFLTLLKKGSTIGGQKIIVTEEDGGETLRVKIVNA